MIARLDGRQDSVPLTEPPSGGSTQDVNPGLTTPTFGSPSKRSDVQSHQGMTPPKGKPHLGAMKVNYANVLQGKTRNLDEKCTIEEAMKGKLFQSLQTNCHLSS